PSVNGPLVEGITAVSGVGISGSTVELFIDGNAAASATAGSTSAWTVVLASPLKAGQQGSATQRVAEGTSDPSIPLTVVAIPPPPTVASPIYAGATVVAGSGIPDASLEVLADGVSLGTTAVTSGGSWALPIAPPLIGGQSITAVQVVAGVPSPMS